jgi:TonB family protein
VEVQFGMKNQEPKRIILKDGIKHFDYRPDFTGIHEMKLKQLNGNASCVMILLAVPKPVGNLKMEIRKDSVYIVVDELPQLVAGDDRAFNKWYQKHFEIPEVAKKKNIQGKAYVQFVIDSEGNMRNIKVIRGVDAEVDAYLVEFFKTCPKWETPGKIGKQFVSTYFTMPVLFTSPN